MKSDFSCSLPFQSVSHWADVTFRAPFSLLHAPNIPISTELTESTSGLGLFTVESMAKSMIFTKNDNDEDEDADDWWQLATLARDTCWAWGRLGVRAEQPVPRKQLLYTPTILRDTVAHLAHSSYFILLGTG